MKLLDKIAFNRLLKILTDFILSIIQILQPKNKIPNKPTKPRKKIIDRIFK